MYKCTRDKNDNDNDPTLARSKWTPRHPNPAQHIRAAISRRRMHAHTHKHTYMSDLISPFRHLDPPWRNWRNGVAKLNGEIASIVPDTLANGHATTLRALLAYNLLSMCMRDRSHNKLVVFFYPI